MAVEELVELKFRLLDGSDIGPSKYNSTATVISLKENIIAHWPKVLDPPLENPRQKSCQKEIQQKSMRHCIMWMMEGRGRQESFLRSAVANPRYQEEHLQECCDQMKMMSSECVCDVIKKMMMDMQSKYGTQEMEQMVKKAESLPMMCEMKSPTECRMRAVYL